MSYFMVIYTKWKINTHYLGNILIMSEVSTGLFPEFDSNPAELKQDDLSVEAYKEALRTVDLARLLASNALEGVDLSASRIQDYDLLPLQIPDTDRYNFGWAQDFYDTRSTP